MTAAEFPTFMESYEKLVYTICYQFTRQHHTAQDLAQETFLSAFTHMESCPAESPKAWVARIATNKAKDHLKSAYNRRVNYMDDQTLPDGPAEVMFAACEAPEATALQNETLAEVSESIRNLRAPYNEVAALYFLAERDIADIAEALGRPRKTVQTQLRRAKEQLRCSFSANAPLAWAS